MSIRIDCCVNIKNDLIKLVGKKWHMGCSTKYLLRFVCLILSRLSTMTHSCEDKFCKLIMQHDKSARKGLKGHLPIMQNRARNVSLSCARRALVAFEFQHAMSTVTRARQAAIARDKRPLRALSRAPHFMLPLPRDMRPFIFNFWFKFLLKEHAVMDFNGSIFICRMKLVCNFVRQVHVSCATSLSYKIVERCLCVYL